MDELSLRGELTPEQEKEWDGCLWGALAFVGNIYFNKAYARARRELVPPGSLDSWGYYFDVSTLGRACAVACVQTLCGTDWFRVRAEELLAMQEKDGGWRCKAKDWNPMHEVNNSCMAMMFLMKAGPLVLSENRRGAHAPPRKTEK